MPSGYTRPASNRQPAGLLDVMNATKPSFWGLLGQNVQGVGMGLLDALMAPGNAAAGQYDAYYDPSSGQTTYGRNGNPYAMMGDASNLSGFVTLGAGAVPRPVGTLDMGIRAYHGTPHSFDAFDISKIGTGEGAQAYGHGLYFAENKAVAKAYRDTVTDSTLELGGKPFVLKDLGIAKIVKANKLNPSEMARQLRQYANEYADNPYADAGDALKLADAAENGTLKTRDAAGNLYEVDINAEPHDFLDWDKPLSEQSDKVKQAVQSLLPDIKIKTIAGQNYMFVGNSMVEMPGKELTGRDAYIAIRMAANPKTGGVVRDSAAIASQSLKSTGVQGIKYLDAGSRGAGDGSRNYVVFHHDPVKITGKISM